MSLVRACGVVVVVWSATAMAQSESTDDAFCVARGTIALPEIVVPRSDSEPFRIRATRASVEVMPVAGEPERLDISVDDPLSFRGTVPTRDVPFALAGSVRAFGGMLVLGRGV